MSTLEQVLQFVMRLGQVTQAFPVLLGYNPLLQAVQVPSLEQVLQFAMRLGQVTQAV